MSDGTAVVKLTPPVGGHSYKAVFKGTTTNSPSTSPAQWLTVSGQTTTTISVSGSPGNYSLTGTVVAKGTTLSPTGTVSFVDTSDNQVIGSATLGSAKLDQKLGASNLYVAGVGPSALKTGDFNGDGLVDLVVSDDSALDVLLGNGDGTFRAYVKYAVGNGPLSVAVGDVNGDGIRILWCSL